MTPRNLPKVAVVVPNRNGKDFIRDCLKSLTKQTIACQIIVVDNGSTDGSLGIIKKSYPEIELIELPENRGFAGGVNIGIKKALDNDFGFVALLNNDAAVESNWLEQLVSDAAEHPQIGIVTSKFMRADKKHLDSTGDFYSIWGLPFPRGRNEVDGGQYDDKKEIFGGSGGASLYSSEMLKQIGLFDEDFFAYFEDVDISFRAQLAGWRVIYQPKAIAYHYIGGTSSRLGNFARYHSVKNFMLVYAKNMPSKLYFKYSLLYNLQLTRWLISSILR